MRSGRMSAPIERFNRPLQESFTDYRENLPASGLARFNPTLVPWLRFYNPKERPPLSTRNPHTPSAAHNHNAQCLLQWIEI